MSIGSIQPRQIGGISAPSSLIPRRFGFEIRAWVMLATLFSSGICAFASQIKPPYRVTTPTLDPNDLDGSYKQYASSFEGALNDWVEDLNEAAPLSSSSHEHERLLENSVVVAPPGAFTPIKLPLEGAFRADLNNSFSKPSGALFPESPIETIRKNAALNGVAGRAAKIIQTWHPDDLVEITKIGLDSSKDLLGRVSKYHRSDKLPGHHIDDDHLAVLTLPSTQYPLNKGEAWITTDGAEVLLKEINHDSNSVVVEDSLGNTSTLTKDKLHHQKCASGTTTPFVPGLIDDSPENKFTLPGSINNSRIAQLAADLINYSVTTTLNSSALIPASELVHTSPFEKVDPNKSLLEGCKYIFRKLLFVFYELSCPRPAVFV